MDADSRSVLGLGLALILCVVFLVLWIVALRDRRRFAQDAKRRMSTWSRVGSGIPFFNDPEALLPVYVLGIVFISGLIILVAVVFLVGLLGLLGVSIPIG